MAGAVDEKELQVAGVYIAVFFAAMVRATCFAMALRDKSQKSLHRVTEALALVATLFLSYSCMQWNVATTQNHDRIWLRVHASNLINATIK